MRIEVDNHLIIDQPHKRWDASNSVEDKEDAEVEHRKTLYLLEEKDAEVALEKFLAGII